ncbi:MAG: prepilin-type N-terminal cleavage/methylation domain-containing protein, partial [Candidatus Baltobacteraceae bacterium]
MENQRGFTLVEIVVAVACTAILLVGGGSLLASMHPGALRNALDDFDANIAVARAVAAGSGNGATLTVLPRIDANGNALPGFALRVYSGRPNAAGAVQPANVMPIESSASIEAAQIGKPPFSIFLSSAGHPSAVASYPAVDSHGVASFRVLSSQPPCPAPAIVLTFTSPQGATETRTLQCAASATGLSVPNASPTPNAPVVVPGKLVAHWTTDGSALHFVAAEFGYTHWFASDSGATCGSVATFIPGWPYAPPHSVLEAGLSPSPPAAPYSWPNNGAGSMNDAPAPFRMSPVRGAPGLCAVDIVDDYAQHAGAQIQVMGDLSSTSASLTFASPAAGAQTIGFSKSYDSEDLNLMWGGSCSGLVTVAQTAKTTQSSPTARATTATLTIDPKGSAGSCSLTVSDQYGEPAIAIPVEIKTAQAMKTWPQMIVMSSSLGTLAAAPRARSNVAELFNTLL